MKNKLLTVILLSLFSVATEASTSVRADYRQNKNANIVTKEIDDGWQRLIETGLSEKLDSAKEYPLAYAYYHERQMIKDLFRNYGTTQKKYLAELDRHMPPMVKMIATLDKKK